jgi:predicted ATP-dependent endonuclease of OLD family
MKIKEITLQNYKRFVKKQTFSFCNEDGEVNDMTLLVGDNGSGKSSVLQAIIMLIAPTASTRIQLNNLGLPGFDFAYIQTGNMPINVSCTISLSESETQATLALAKQLKSIGKPIGLLPDIKKNIQLKLDIDKKRISANSLAQYFQLSGYNYANQLKRYDKKPNLLFQDIGFIFWYNEQRTAFSLSNHDSTIEEDIVIDSIEKLRGVIIGLFYTHINVTERNMELPTGLQDFYKILEDNFKKIFPTRSFVGAAPRRDNPTIQDFWLSDGQNQYELAGMSAGERAIFPLLVDFSLNNINNSIIIIDELELHLHPPLQQALVRALPKLGNNNQFIITTHSDDVAFMFNQNQIIRL